MSTQNSGPERVRSLFSFIDQSVTPYHAVRATVTRLLEADFVEYRVDQRWDLTHAARGFTRFGDGALVAFRGGSVSGGTTILAAHTDSPALRVKERAVSWKKGYLALPTEIYGGPIVSTWLDRELGIAGRLVSRDGRVHLFDLPHTVIIPNLAIHLNRKVNEGFEYNAQDHLVALLDADPAASDENAADYFARLVAESAGLPAEDGAELEAILYDRTPAGFAGLANALYSAGRIDNLAGCFTNLEAFLEAVPDHPAMLVLYNHEEIGSQTGEGAHSAMIERVLQRLVSAEGGDAEALAVAMARSTVVSNDAGHALHPSFADKYDPDYAPVLGGGPVLKINGKYRYATTASSAAAFARACETAGVPLQRLANRSDARSGSTVGPLTWTKTGIRTVDVGLPLLAMHSIRETAGSGDVEQMIRALVAFLDSGKLATLAV